MELFLALIAFITGIFSFNGQAFSDLLKNIGIILCLTLIVTCVPACTSGTEPLERSMQQVMKEVIGPAVAKAGEELSARTAQYQGQGSFINPGYQVDGFANFGPGVAYRFNIHAEGVSANIAGATQADAGQAGTVDPPAKRVAPLPSQ